MKTWQQRHAEEAARRAEVDELLAQVRTGRPQRAPEVRDHVSSEARARMAAILAEEEQRLAEHRAGIDTAAAVPAWLPDLVAEPTPAPEPRPTQPPAAALCLCSHKGISHPRWGKCNRLACGCGSFRDAE